MTAKIKKPVVSDKEVALLETEIRPVVASASKVVIKNEQDMAKAAEILSQVNQYADRVDAEYEKVADPLNAALKAYRTMFKPLKTRLEESIENIRSAMSAYQTKKRCEADEEAARIAERVGEGKGKIKVETAVAKIAEIEKPADSVVAESGVVKFRTQQRLKITDEAKIPREYLVVDEKKVFEALKAGIEILGAEIELVQVPVNFR